MYFLVGLKLILFRIKLLSLQLFALLIGPLAMVPLLSYLLTEALPFLMPILQPSVVFGTFSSTSLQLIILKLMD